MSVPRYRPKLPLPDPNVGYKKPPRHTRFQPGQSGNPQGRPKGSRNFASAVKDLLGGKVRVVIDGSPRVVSTLEAALLRLKDKGLGGGDLRALSQIIELAKEYLKEERAEGGIALTSDETVVFETFKARLLSGALQSPEEEEKALQKPADKDDRLGGYDALRHDIRPA